MAAHRQVGLVMTTAIFMIVVLGIAMPSAAVAVTRALNVRWGFDTEIRKV